jgi:L-iditol 2-dehydrogenase
LSSRLDATTVFGEAKRIYTHTFPLAEVPTAIRYARDRVDDAIKVIVQNRAV